MGLEGKIITGKWNKNSYKIISLLGKGGIGKVYKALNMKDKTYYALKISEDLHSITKESNMLDKFHQIRTIPSAIELDDYEEAGKTYYFIVLEYIYGENLKRYILKNKLNLKEIVGIVIIIGEVIEQFHKKGYIFGDLKLENIMMDKRNGEIRIIDLGSVVPIGASIKEFTPLYDRAKWDMGFRRADVKYDLFAICMIFVNLILRNENKLLDMEISHIIKELKKRKINKKIIRLIIMGLYQKNILFEEFLNELKKTYKTLRNEMKIRYNDRVNLIINVFFITSFLSFVIILAFSIKSI
ncbi:protein kinase domain-containing protein [Maledivibacter halophilus]|uniref:Serine/threonine protein kinase n=1 Tax=Maledivibacter halophilus TaxID=36842 RepID=A0A1T5MSC7_9FIRM|nr:protein kinase [Maledivibacter halophilus]SKC91126.1 serine/threonine protein kinase [Maledivibacter halophilus]